MKYQHTIWESVVFGLIVAFLAITAFPSSEEKQAAGLRLNPPVESPDGVTFVWTGGAADTSYRIMRRISGTDEWQPVAIGLNPSGMYLYKGFTLDRDYQYRIEADPE